MPATINGTTGFGGNLTGNVTGNVAGTSSAIADGAVSAAKLDGVGQGAGNPPVYGCRAWVNFNGTRNSTDTGASTNGANVLIRASGNVASVLKNGTGDYTITFTTAMPDVNYAAFATTGTTGTSTNAIIGYELNIASRSTSSVRIASGNNESDAFTEMPQVSVAIFR